MKSLHIKLACLILLLGAPMCAQQSPRIFYSDLESGPNSAGENNLGAYVTLYGKGFGSAQGSSTVSVGGGSAAAYAVWNDSMITFQLGPSAATGNIVVNTSSGSSNPVPFTVRSGNIYFVSTSGADTNTGSFSAPWRSLLKARDSMKPGDITYAMDGVAQSTDDGQGWHAAMLLQTSGAAGAPIAIAAYPGANVTIGDINGPDNGIRSKGYTSYWVFAGLKLRGKYQAVSTYGDSNWRVIGNDMTCPNGDGASACFETSIVNYLKMYGNNVHDTGVVNASALYQGVYFSTDSNHIDFGWNTIANVHGCRGLQVHSSPLFGGGSTDPTGHNQFDLSIHDSIIHDTQCDGIILATIDPSQGAIRIYNNLIYNAGKGPNNPEGSGYWSCINVETWTNTGPTGSGTVEIFNNTMYNCGSFTKPTYNNSNGAVAYSGPNGNINVHIRNNIMHVPAGIPYILVNRPNGGLCATSDDCPWMYGSNNLFFGSGGGPTNTYITNSVSQDPLMVNPAAGDFHLTSGSPAAQGGAVTELTTDLDGIPLPQGTFFPIGAYAVPLGSYSPATPAITVSVSPSSARLQAGQQQTFTATVTGTTDSTVTWSVSPAVGSFTSPGVYVAPASITTQQQVVVTATSAADPTKSGSVTVILAPPPVVGITLTPGTATLTSGQTVQFTAAVSGSSNTGVTWSLNTAVGSISGTGLYTAPATISAQQTIQVIATPSADPTTSATAIVSLRPPVTVAPISTTITPALATLSGGQKLQFTATVSGTNNTGVTWAISPAIGSISNSGVYTAPTKVTAQQTVRVTATASADPTQAATAAVALVKSPTTTSPTTPAVSLSVQNGNLIVSFTAPAGQPANDWIGLSSVDAPGWWDPFYVQTQGQTSGSMTVPLSSLPAGILEGRYYGSGSYTILARSAPYAYSTQGFSVKPDSTSVAPGAQLSLKWTAGTGRTADDLIRLYPLGAASDAPVWSISTAGLATGSSSGWPAPLTTGTYELRYIIGNTYYEVAKSVTIKVQ